MNEARRRPRNFCRLVQADRVHRRCYVDPEVFEAEMTEIFERSWIYAGHISQVPNPGDYVSVLVARQPVIMLRGSHGTISVLYNRCPHRGVMICAADQGNAGPALICPYHAWRFGLDGKLRSVPLSSGYEGTAFNKDSPEFHMKPVAALSIYRGFVFVRLSANGPSFEAWAGEAITSIDDLCDRSPVGEVEVVQPRFRVLQKSNWKLFMENQLDALHAPLTHESAARAASSVSEQIERRSGVRPESYVPLTAVDVPVEDWQKLRTRNFPYGHGILEGYLPHPSGPEQDAYEALLAQHHGAQRAREILSDSIHHALFYPSLSIQPVAQQLRVIRPIAVDKTISELWHFRLKEAPEPLYRRALNFFNLVNSPSTLVNADDLENWTRAQRGLSSSSHDWVSFQRNSGTDRIAGDVVESTNGMSEVPMRNQFVAWTRYMQLGQTSND